MEDITDRVYARSSGDLKYVIFFTSTLYEDSNYVGSVSVVYDIGVLNLIIGPLYQDADNDNSDINLFIYANIYD